MTTHIGRAGRLKQIERQITLVGVQVASYSRTLQRAETDGDTARVAEYTQRLASAAVAGYDLRMQWIGIKLEMCERAAKRRKAS